MSNGSRDSTEQCKRNFTKEQLLAGLKAGHLFYVDRSDAPELADLTELEQQGLVKKRLVQFDEQGSAMEYWWTGAEEQTPGTEEASTMQQKEKE